MKKGFSKQAFRFLAWLLMLALLQAGSPAAIRALAEDSDLARCLRYFEEAYNRRALDDIGDAFDVNIMSAYYYSALLMGVDGTERAEDGTLFFSRLFPTRPVRSKEDLPTCSLQMTDVEEDGEEGILTADVTLSYADGTQEYFVTKFPYRRAGYSSWIILAMPESVPKDDTLPETALTESETDEAEHAEEESPEPAAQDPEAMDLSPQGATENQAASEPENEEDSEWLSEPAGSEEEEDSGLLSEPATPEDGDDSELLSEPADPEEEDSEWLTEPADPENGEDSGSLQQAISAPASEEEPETEASRGENAVTVESYLASTVIGQVNVRKNPDRHSELITRLEEIGTPLTVIGEAMDAEGQKWFHVELRSGKKGYVRSNLIGDYDPEAERRREEERNKTPEPTATRTPAPTDTPAPTETPAPTAEKTEEATKAPKSGKAEQPAETVTFPAMGKTNVDKVNVRAKADRKGKRVTYIVNQGTTVQVTGRKKSGGEEWYRVEVDGKTGGYVLASTIDLISAEEAAEEEAGQSRFPIRMTTNKKKINLRTRPDPGARRVTYIQRTGTAVTVLEEVVGKDKNTWYHIQLDDNQTGYALTKYFDPAEE